MKHLQILGLLMMVVFAFTSCRHGHVRVSNDEPHTDRRPRSKRHPRAEKKGPPPWAPAHGYRRKQRKRYYYFPRYNFYYDNHRQVYIYYEGNGWSFEADIPLDLHEDDLEKTRKVQIEYDGDDPYAKNRHHREEYEGRKRRGGPPGHRGGKKGRGKGKGKGRGKGKGPPFGRGD